MRLIRIELKKIIYNRIFWGIGIIYMLVLAFVLFSLQNMINNMNDNTVGLTLVRSSIYKFPDIWHNLAFIASYFKIFLGIIIIIFITNEVSYKTLKQSVINGLTRKEFLVSKFWLILIVTSFSTLFLLLISFILGFINSHDVVVENIFSKIIFMLAYFVEILGFLSFSLLIGYLFYKSGISIILLLFYFYIAEPLIRWKIPSQIAAYFPMKAIGSITQPPDNILLKIFEFKTQQNISLISMTVALIWIVIFWVLLNILLKNRDL